MSSGRLFQSFGPAEANERSPTVMRRDGRLHSETVYLPECSHPSTTNRAQCRDRDQRVTATLNCDTLRLKMKLKLGRGDPH